MLKWSITVPGPPTNFIVVDTTSTSVQISWSVPSVTNGIILYYTVVYSNTTHIVETVYSDVTFQSNITSLNEYTVYNFTIYANTSAGAGPTVFTEERTDEDRKLQIMCDELLLI